MSFVAEASVPLPVAAARAGDQAAWNALFRRFQLPLYCFVQELLHHEATSLDVVQETFIAAARHLATLRDDDRFGSWLFGIAHQKVVQRWRQAGREQSLDDFGLDATLDESAPDPRDLMLRAEQGAALLALVDELPPVQRAVLVLHLLEDFPLEEIARITAAPLGTVKSRLHHAKRALRARLAATGDGTTATPCPRP